MRTELVNLPQPNWFWHGEAILGLVERHRPMICVELGTNRGCSAIATGRLLQRWGGRLACIDTWETEHHGASVTSEQFWQSVRMAGLDNVISIYRMRIDHAAQQWTEPIDYLYVDADHTIEAVTSDLECWWPHLKVGGLIAGDDYDDPNDAAVPKNVTAAWDIFEARHEQAFERVVTGAQGRLIWGIKQ
jgi:predicted O-methyltransferase YrrM